MTTKEKIFSIASRLFHEKGFASTSVRELASLVGIEAASLYNHIQSKTDLLEQICFETGQAFTSNLNDVLLADLSTFETLNHILQFHIDMAIHDPKVLTVFSQEWRHLPEPSLSQFIEERKSYESGINSILKKGQENGQISPHLNTEVLSKLFLSSIQWIYFSRPDVVLKNEREIRLTVEFFIKKMMAQDASSSNPSLIKHNQFSL